MKKHCLLAGLALLCAAAAAPAENAGVLGDWKTPTGSIVRVDVCDPGICLTIVQLAATVKATTDIHNPDPRLRSRALCGLQIGKGFQLEGPDRASGGTLYDPKTGKTYRGNLTADGATLHLRGYVGIPLFGASQDWARSPSPLAVCDSNTHRPPSF